MVKKEFTYRGYKFEELKNLSRDEFANLLTARKKRSLKRGLAQNYKKLLERSKKAGDKMIRTHQREMIILPEFVGKTFAVHNGKEFTRIDVKPEMIGYCLGEFAQTRRRVQHSSPGMGATRSSKYVALK